MMKPYLKHFIMVATPLLLFMLLFGLWVEPLHGDLTRTGKWSEREYGANADSPAVEIKASNAQTEANAWVLGDSFSDRHIWQSLMSEQTKHQFKTFNYGNCIEQFIDDAINNTATDLVMIESIERDFIDRFSKAQTCQKVKSTSLTIKADVADFKRPDWPLTMNIMYLVKTAFNTLRSAYQPNAIFSHNRVINTPIDASCAKFSHQRQNRFLYYADDENKRHWTAEQKLAAAQVVLNIQKRVEAKGKQFLFMLVPDKSTVYQACLPKLPLSDEAFEVHAVLKQVGVNTLDLHILLKGESNQTIDVYEPNNTHWSLAGYRLVANHLVAQLKGDAGLKH